MHREVADGTRSIGFPRRGAGSGAFFGEGAIVALKTDSERTAHGPPTPGGRDRPRDGRRAPWVGRSSGFGARRTRVPASSVDSCPG
jgi:hypothetical protein